jgi:hypothetical protein
MQKLYIENTTPYFQYIEWGTYEYWDTYGLDSFPKNTEPKKKDMLPEERKLYKKGMQPFSPIRKVLYNNNLMSSLVSKAFKSQL